jgi:hypothetical protein
MMVMIVEQLVEGMGDGKPKYLEKLAPVPLLP